MCITPQTLFCQSAQWFPVFHNVTLYGSVLPITSCYAVSQSVTESRMKMRLALVPYNGSASAVTETFSGHCEASQSHHGACHWGVCHWGGTTPWCLARHWGGTIIWCPPLRWHRRSGRQYCHSWWSDSHRCVITHLLLWYILYFWKGADHIWIWVFNLKLGGKALQEPRLMLEKISQMFSCLPQTQCVIRKIPVS